MIFDLLTFLRTILAGFNVSGIEEQALAWLKEKGEEYPDLRSRTDALAAWLGTTLAEASPNIDPDKMRDTLWGIASDVVHGTAGIDPAAWQGGA